MTLLDCQHIAGGESRYVCRHLLESKGTDYIQNFTGKGVAFNLLCSQCRQESEINLRTVCPECFKEILAEGSWEGISGQPQVLERDSGFRFHHETLHLAGVLHDPILDIQPVPCVDQNLWIVVSQSGQLLRLDLDNRSAVPLCPLPESSVNLSEPISLHVSRNGQMGAVVNTRGRHGIVLDLDTGQATLSLDRGDYHNAHCNFPVAFCEAERRLLLIHGTAWNRLDISDPLTGMLLSERTFAPYRQGGPRPEHYLDYFHCGLTVSPNHEYVADNGWVWHPVGVVAAWSIRRWLRENVWESEDGMSKHVLCDRSYFWDGPLCWVGEDRLAIWGHGEDDEWLIPAVRIFNVMNGKEERWFPGPKGSLVCDDHLFSFDGQDGTSVWDVNSGERLLHEKSFCPLRYHRGTKAFLTLGVDGMVQVSKIRWKPLDPAWLTWGEGAVVRVAQAIFQRRAFDQLPILADALEEAGCQDAEILAHCRQPGPHTGSCWVLDLLLRRE
jgi:hypothetical protein